MPDAADKLSDDESEEARTLSLWRQPLVHICQSAVDFRTSAQRVMTRLIKGPAFIVFVQ